MQDVCTQPETQIFLSMQMYFSVVITQYRKNNTLKTCRATSHTHSLYSSKPQKSNVNECRKFFYSDEPHRSKIIYKMLYAIRHAAVKY